MTSYEEWRVTGTPRLKPIHRSYLTEAEARGFIAAATAPCAWVDGPHLHRRTVTVTEWEPVEDGQVSASPATQAAQQPPAQGSGTAAPPSLSVPPSPLTGGQDDDRQA